MSSFVVFKNYLLECIVAHVEVRQGRGSVSPRPPRQLSAALSGLQIFVPCLTDSGQSSGLGGCILSLPPLWGAAFSLLIAPCAVQKLFDFTPWSIPGISSWATGALCRKPLPLPVP